MPEDAFIQPASRSRDRSNERVHQIYNIEITFLARFWPTTVMDMVEERAICFVSRFKSMVCLSTRETPRPHDEDVLLRFGRSMVHLLREGGVVAGNVADVETEIKL